MAEYCWDCCEEFMGPPEDCPEWLVADGGICEGCGLAYLYEDAETTDGIATEILERPSNADTDFPIGTHELLEEAAKAGVRSERNRVLRRLDIWHQHHSASFDQFDLKNISNYIVRTAKEVVTPKQSIGETEELVKSVSNQLRQNKKDDNLPAADIPFKEIVVDCAEGILGCDDDTVFWKIEKAVKEAARLGYEKGLSHQAKSQCPQNETAADIHSQIAYKIMSREVFPLTERTRRKQLMKAARLGYEKGKEERK
jgi:hypothetical protein